MTPAVGMLVRVIYPEYVAGIRGIIRAREPSGRWIVELEENNLQDSQNPVLLSLEASDFEVIAPLDSGTGNNKP